jgi:hypothetical protein
MIDRMLALYMHNVSSCHEQYEQHNSRNLAAVDRYRRPARLPYILGVRYFLKPQPMTQDLHLGRANHVVQQPLL